MFCSDQYVDLVEYIVSCILMYNHFLFRETGADESEIRVGFVTYAKELHFYNVKVSGVIIMGTFLQCQRRWCHYSNYIPQLCTVLPFD